MTYVSIEKLVLIDNVLSRGILLGNKPQTQL